jgi:LysR family transcriptional regulator of gallate degradation
MYQDMTSYPALRALRRALAVSDKQHLTRAAEGLRRSQSAITRSVTGLEEFIGLDLFERTATGMFPTREGEVLFRRVRAAMDQMNRAREQLSRMPELCTARRGAYRLLDFDVSNAYVFTFLALCDHRDIRKAAQFLEVAPSTVRKAINDLERQLGLRLFDRAPRGTVYPNSVARVIAASTKRALWEIRAGLNELRSLDGSISGEVRVGVMSTARSYIIPRAVDRLRRLHRDVLVDVHWANYTDLKLALSCGDIDCIVGALRAEDVNSAENSTIVLMKDRAEVVVRADHPLTSAGQLSLAELLALDWILPPPHFPLRIWFRQVLESEGLPEPRPFMQTASLAILRGTLLDSDCAALSTRLQCWHDTVEHRLLAALPIGSLSRAHEKVPFHLHLTKRAHSEFSPAAEELWRLLIEVAGEARQTLFPRSSHNAPEPRSATHRVGMTP